MKKMLSIISVCISFGYVYAQPDVTVNPPTFTAEDEITITVDVSKTSLNNYNGQIYMWAWIAEGCAAKCDAPSNVDPAGTDATKNAEMTRDVNNPNVYSITIVPSVFYNKPPSELKKIGFKLKSGSWGDNKQTDSDAILNVEPLVFTRKVSRVFPAKVTKDDVITLYLDQVAALSPDLKYELSDFTITVSALDAAENEVGKIVNAPIVNEGDGVHRFRILPTHNFGTNDIESIKYTFKSVNSDVESEEYMYVFFK